MDYVVKIGGSLFPEASIRLLNELKGQNCLIITGGGKFADLIRQYDEKINFSDSGNHKSAIIAMDIIATLLSDKVKFSETVNSIGEARNLLKQFKLPIMLCSNNMELLDSLEHSWKVSSDSIACYFANLIGAKLIIATDVDGLYTSSSYNNNVDFINLEKQDKSNGNVFQLRDDNFFNNKNLDNLEFISEITAKKLLSFDETCVDEKLPELLLDYRMDCYVVNGNFPDRVLSLIKNEKVNKNFLYTLIRGD